MRNPIPSSKSRVAQHTPPSANARIREKTLQEAAKARRNPNLLNQRISQLEREWDIERALEANAASFSLLGFALSTRNRKWLALPLVVATFLLQHSVQGWCPPLTVLRRLGFRTRDEINAERDLLKKPATF